MKPYPVKIRSMTPGTTITVRVYITQEFRFRFRLWLARKLIALACYVLGWRLELKVTPDWKGG